MLDTVSSTLARELKIPHLVARFLVSRGVCNVVAASRILCEGGEAELSPWGIKGMEDAVRWILDVRENKHKIFIFGDYDLDGMTSVTLLSRSFAQIGIETDWRLPNRFGDGYGLSVSAVDEMYEAGARYVVTVDTGITANAEIAHARELGMHVMVIDHHQPSGDALPPCDVLLDPHQEGDSYSNPELCGVGVSYKFICALYERLGMPSPVEMLDLVALGTLADLVQMTPENRMFTKKGLRRLQESRLPGIQALYASLMKPGSCVGGIDVMYKFAPLLNAPGRMEKPDPALKLLLCPDNTSAPQLLAELKDWNTKRKQKEAEITEMAMKRVKEIYGEEIPKVLVVDGPGWHVGVIGIVSAKLAQEFSRPAAVLSIVDGMAHASARAVPGFNWHRALHESGDLFDRWGGHANAAGFSLPADKIDELRGRLDVSAREQGYTGGVPAECGTRGYDIVVALRELVVEGTRSRIYKTVLDYFDRMEPFGGNFPYPVFKAEDVTVHKVKELRGGHLQLEISQAGSPVFSAIAFGLGKCKEKLKETRKATVVFEPTWNYFNNKKTLQLCIKSIE
jgi:single-stranded-DNA-specific exonuclease